MMDLISKNRGLEWHDSVKKIASAFALHSDHVLDNIITLKLNTSV